MPNVPSVIELPMPKRNVAGGAPDRIPARKTENVKVYSDQAEKLREVVEARGRHWSIAMVAEELFGDGLDSLHAAVQPKLKQIRAIQAQAAEPRRATRKSAAAG